MKTKNLLPNMTKTFVAIAFAAVSAVSLRAAPMGTAFTYLGRLNDGGAPANGLYDFQFKLYDGPITPPAVPVGLPLPRPVVGVTNGLFMVTLDFGPQFQADARWLEVWANTNGFAPVLLTPRQELTPTPYALYAAAAGFAGTAGSAGTAFTVPWGGISGVPPGFADGVDNDTQYYAGSGLILITNTFFLDLVFTDARYWKLNGNGGTSSANFLGTTDNKSLEIKVNNARALWIRPTVGVPNLIGGSLYNGTAAGVEGAFIGGGGSSGADNSLYASFGALGGGVHNRIDGVYGFLGGGGTNRILASASHGVLNGGQGNTLGGDHGVISGGWGNYNQTSLGTIGGGANNLVQSPYSATIAGGYQNTVLGQDATIGGGSYNTNQADYAIIAGGQFNYVGTNIFLAGDALTTNYAGSSCILGGAGNRISSLYSGIGGGGDNFLYGDYGHIGGGAANRIGSLSDFSSSYSFSTIGGGSGNQIWNSSATVGGGTNNQARGLESAVLGGGGNTAWSQRSTVLGGQYNEAGTNTGSGAFALAAGRRAKARHQGSFVWGDSTDDDIVSTNANSITFRATGGVRIFSYVDPTHILADVGVRLAAGSGSWASMSDRNAKNDFQAVDQRQILEKVAAMPITTWRYNGEDAAIRHIGPTAQDFRAAFAMGDEDTSITSVDADGVALAAIQGLNQKLKDREAELNELKRDMAQLKELLRQAIQK